MAFYNFMDQDNHFKSRLNIVIYHGFEKFKSK